MKTFSKMIWVPLLAVLIAALPAFAQSPEDAKDRSPYSQAELDQMLAPIALYPDALLSQLLMAATYPLEIVQAARWSRSHPDLHGEEAVRAVAQFDWDPSVKSLVAFPRLLQQMDQQLEWTERLGNAFLGQEYDLLRAVQELRWRAYAAGNLRSSDELTLRLEGTDFSLEAPASDMVHVPYYDSRVVYGSWDWPQYEPVYWNPWPDYSWHPGYTGIGWTVGIPVSTGFFFGTCDWAGRHVRFGHHRPFYFRALHRWQRGGLWRHDRDHRRGVAYRNIDSRHQVQRGDRVDVGNRARDARRDARPQDRPTVERRVESNELQRSPQPGAAVPRAEVRSGGVPQYRIERPSEEPRPMGIERSRPAPMPPPVQAVPQSPQPSALSRPVQAAPRAYEPPALARPSSAPESRSSPQPAPAPALARPEAPSSPPQSQPSGSGEGGGIRRRER